MQDGKRIAVQIPEGAIVLVIDSVPEYQSGDVRQEVNVQWKGKTYTVFLVDLQERVARVPWILLHRGVYLSGMRRRRDASPRVQ
jgi:hypothetical protein